VKGAGLRDKYITMELNRIKYIKKLPTTAGITALFKFELLFCKTKKYTMLPNTISDVVSTSIITVKIELVVDASTAITSVGSAIYKVLFRNPAVFLAKFRTVSVPTTNAIGLLLTFSKA
jgi:hypothetical protein